MPISRRSSAVVLGAGLLALTSCNVLDSGGPICTGQFVSGIHVSVQDSVTGVPAASGATLIAIDGSYADTASIPAQRPDLDSRTLLAAGERAGTYDLTVRKAGFLDWHRTSVVVTPNECHVNPVEMTARLKPAP